MFKKLVNNLYIGKSKLKFYKPSTIGLQPNAEVRNTTIFKHIVVRNYIKSPNQYLPDAMVNGFFENSKEGPNLKLVDNPGLSKHHRLYITGIPKDSPNLDFFRVKGSIWSSYYEDSYRGYLFQITTSETPLELLESPRITNNKYQTE